MAALIQKQTHLIRCPLYSPKADIAEPICMSAKCQKRKKGRRWRLQITAPNGSLRLFGRFYSEKRARMASHLRLADAVAQCRLGCSVMSLWVRSRTSQPHATFFSPQGRRSGGGGSTFALLAAPLRRALVEEGVEPLAEVFAHVTHQNQVPAFLARQPAREPRQSLFGGVERERCMACDQRCQFGGAFLQRRHILDDF